MYRKNRGYLILGICGLIVGSMALGYQLHEQETPKATKYVTLNTDNMTLIFYEPITIQGSTINNCTIITEYPISLSGSVVVSYSYIYGKGFSK